MAEAGDTLFASFIGTKQYKWVFQMIPCVILLKIITTSWVWFFFTYFLERDIIADANILQGAIFHEDAVEVSDGCAPAESDKGENQNGKEYMWNPLESRSKQLKSKSKPAAHRVNNLVFHQFGGSYTFC